VACTEAGRAKHKHHTATMTARFDIAIHFSHSRIWSDKLNHSHRYFPGKLSENNVTVNAKCVMLEVCQN
jgi:hypothetical protein